MDDLKKLIRNVPGFPTEGIVFRDISTLLADSRAVRAAVDAIAEHYAEASVEVVVGAEARGFIFGPLVAERLNAGFAINPAAMSDPR